MVQHLGFIPASRRDKKEMLKPVPTKNIKSIKYKKKEEKMTAIKTNKLLKAEIKLKEKFIGDQVLHL
jgi:hypothetical protein